MDGKTWHFSDTFPVHDGVSGSLISNEISSQIVSFMMFLSSASAASEAFLITYVPSKLDIIGLKFVKKLVFMSLTFSNLLFHVSEAALLWLSGCIASLLINCSKASFSSSDGVHGDCLFSNSGRM